MHLCTRTSIYTLIGRGVVSKCPWGKSLGVTPLQRQRCILTQGVEHRGFPHRVALGHGTLSIESAYLCIISALFLLKTIWSNVQNQNIIKTGNRKQNIRPWLPDISIRVSADSIRRFNSKLGFVCCSLNVSLSNLKRYWPEKIWCPTKTRW